MNFHHYEILLVEDLVMPIMKSPHWGDVNSSGFMQVANPMFRVRKI
jgi:hypothetical protein